MRAMRDVTTMSIPCIRSSTSKGHGHDAAAVIADLVVRASKKQLAAGTGGLGKIKPNGYHGSDRDAFYVHRAEDGVRDWWNPTTDTFVPPRQFCTNHVFVRTTRSGSQEYKCLGHPTAQLTKREDDPFQYADGTELSTRVKKERFIQNMWKSVAAVEATLVGDYSLFIGYNVGTKVLQDADSPVRELAVRNLNTFHCCLLYTSPSPRDRG